MVIPYTFPSFTTWSLGTSWTYCNPNMLPVMWKITPVSMIQFYSLWCQNWHPWGLSSLLCPLNWTLVICLSWSSGRTTFCYKWYHHDQLCHNRRTSWCCWMEPQTWKISLVVPFSQMFGILNPSNNVTWNDPGGHSLCKPSVCRIHPCVYLFGHIPSTSCLSWTSWWCDLSFHTCPWFSLVPKREILVVLSPLFSLIKIINWFLILSMVRVTVSIFWNRSTLKGENG